jgi:hypothetical protein
MKAININGKGYFYKKVCDNRFIFPVKYKFYILIEEPKSYIVKKKRFILFGPLVDVEVNEEAVYNLAFETDKMGEFTEFPAEEVRRLEKAFCVNQEIENSIVSI